MFHAGQNRLVSLQNQWIHACVKEVSKPCISGRQDQLVEDDMIWLYHWYHQNSDDQTLGNMLDDFIGVYTNKYEQIIFRSALPGPGCKTQSHGGG